MYFKEGVQVSVHGVENFTENKAYEIIAMDYRIVSGSANSGGPIEETLFLLINDKEKFVWIDSNEVSYKSPEGN